MTGKRLDEFVRASTVLARPERIHGVAPAPFVEPNGVLTGTQVGEYTLGTKICGNVFVATNTSGKEILVTLLNPTEQSSLKLDSGQGERFTHQADLISEAVLPVKVSGIQRLPGGETIVLFDILKGRTIEEAATSWGASRVEIAECASHATRLFVETERAIGTSIAGFTVKSLIGMGGMGNVYLAENSDMGGSIAAVKTIQPSLGHSIDFLESRFRREATALAQLRDNPNVVNIITIDRVEDTLFLVMEYARGKGLDYIIAKSDEGLKLTMAEVHGISGQLCSALMDAHQKGIAHRDIKPENIKVDASGRIKILDFGLAKVSSANLPTRLTRSTAFMGTPEYMPPDHMMVTDPMAADVYAAGVTIFMMLAGRKVYEGHEEGREDLRKLPPSLRDHGVKCGDRLNEVMQKAVAKQIANRYSSIEEFWRELDPVLRLEISNEAVTKVQKPSLLANTIKVAKKIAGFAIAAGLICTAGAFFLSTPLISGMMVGAIAGIGLAAFHSLMQWQPENFILRLLRTTTMSTMSFAAIGGVVISALGGLTIPAAILGAKYGLVLGTGVGLSWPVISWPFKSATNFIATTAVGAAILSGFLLFNPKKLPSLRDVRQNIVEMAVGAKSSGTKVMENLDTDISGAEVDIHQFGTLRVKSVKGANQAAIQKTFRSAQNAFAGFAKKLSGVSTISGELIVVVAPPSNLADPEIRSLVAEKGWAYVPSKTLGNAQLSSGVVYLAKGDKRSIYTAVAGASLEANGATGESTSKTLAKFVRTHVR